MEKTVEIDGVEYKVIPIPPADSPYSALYSEKVKKFAALTTIQEANKLSAELEEIVAKILSKTVTPQPSKKAHETQLLNEVIIVTRKVMEDAGLFRKDKRSNAEESGADGASPAQAAKRPIGTKG